jgi:dihydropteroate synthase
MAAVAKEFDIPLVLMHMLGNPKTMQVAPSYDDIISEIRNFLKEAIGWAENQGISRAKIIIDPGIGFGKTAEDNLLLIKYLPSFTSLNAPILIGPSRKSFIRKILSDDTNKNTFPDLSSIETGTQAAVAAAVLNGAHIVRVHDVANTRATIKIIDAVRKANSKT